MLDYDSDSDKISYRKVMPKEAGSVVQSWTQKEKFTFGGEAVLRKITLNMIYGIYIDLDIGRSTFFDRRTIYQDHGIVNRYIGALAEKLYRTRFRNKVH